MTTETRISPASAIVAAIVGLLPVESANQTAAVEVKGTLRRCDYAIQSS